MHPFATWRSFHRMGAVRAARRRVLDPAIMASTSKCLARNHKSGSGSQSD
jgi:hypothetical protein